MASPSTHDVLAVTDTCFLTFSDRLSVNGVAARRSTAPKISGAVAAHASSDMFKSSVSPRVYGFMSFTVSSSTRAQSKTMGS